MRYVALASMQYGAGNFVLYGGRLGWSNSGGQAITREFARDIVEMASGASGSDIVRICHVPIAGVDGAVPTIDVIRLSDVVRRDVDFLSEENNLSSFDCVIVSGYSSSSPLVRDVLQSYAFGGGGVILEDFRSSGGIDLFQSISPVVVSDVGFYEATGYISWTDDGRSSSIFSDSYLSESIPMISSVEESGVGPLWTVMVVFDTEAERESGVTRTLDLVSSDDVDVDGECFMAVYRSSYMNGIIDVEKDGS